MLSFAEREPESDGIGREERKGERGAQVDVLHAEHADTDAGNGKREARGDAVGRYVEARGIREAVGGDEFPKLVQESEVTLELDRPVIIGRRHGRADAELLSGRRVKRDLVDGDSNHLR